MKGMARTGSAPTKKAKRQLVLETPPKGNVCKPGSASKPGGKKKY